MKKFIFLIFSLMFFFAVSQQSFIKKNYVLNNEDFYIAPVYESDDSMFTFYHSKEKEITNMFGKKINESPLVAALIEDRSILDNIKDAIECNCDAAYNDPKEEFCGGYLLNNSSIHKLLKIKRVRDYAAELVKDIFVELCKLYPQDYKESTINYLTDMLSFIKKIPLHKCRIKNDVLYVDGEQDYDMAFDMRGFILRRYLIDEIPLEDLEKYITATITAIRGTDVSSNPRFMYTALINNNVRYTISAEGNYYRVGNKKEIFVYDDLFGDRYSSSRIKCHTDGSETIYTIEGGWQDKEKWNPSKDRIIIDSRGEVLLEEHE